MNDVRAEAIWNVSYSSSLPQFRWLKKDTGVGKWRDATLRVFKRLLGTRKFDVTKRKGSNIPS